MTLVDADPVAAITTPDGPARSRRRLERRRASARVTAVALSVVAGWEVIAVTGILGRSVYGPVATARTIHDQWALLWFNLAPTLVSAAVGFAVTLAIGVVGFAVMIAIPPLTRAVSAAAVVLGVIPLVAVTPALSTLFSRGGQLTALVTVMSGIIPIFAALARMSALRTGTYQELGQLYGTSRWTWWRRIGLWRALPYIEFGVKAAAPACFLGTIVAEWAGASGDRGLGEVMVNAVFSFQGDLAWATIAIATGVSLLALGLVSAVLAPLSYRSRV